MKEKVVLDIDPGIDDALAIILALNSPELDVMGITTVCGNTTIDMVVNNVFRILNFIDRLDIPVYKGAYKPIVNQLIMLNDIHGTDGLGDIDIPTPNIYPKGNAIEFLLNTAREYPSEVTIIATGPLTNIAIATLLDEDFSSNVKRIISMGGAFSITPYGFGNDTPVAEFNIYTDPEAAKIVYESGAEVYAVGLDVTMNPEACITIEERERIKSEGGRCGILFYEMTKHLAKDDKTIPLHDPLALSYAIDENILDFKKYRVVVELEGRFTRGQTVADKREWLPEFLREKPNIYVAVNVDGRRFKDLMWKRVFNR